ncbi:MAG: hypothetical protein GF404_05785, partial [candidate division Zixibacteria bacterium]|nr:hypothetical protein [candidate division Zixibacteria bacterium]
MLRKLSVIVLVTLFIFSIPAMAEVANNGKYSLMPPSQGKVNLMVDGSEVNYSSTSGKVYLGSSMSNAVGNAREMFGSYTSFVDQQHNATQGRQIVYAGYSNAACDNIYMNWMDIQFIAGNEVRDVHVAIYQFDNDAWDNSVSGGSTTGLTGGRPGYCHIEVTPGTTWPVHSFHFGGDQQPLYTHASYGALCADYAMIHDTLPGASISTFDTGYEGDDIDQPYIWPHFDIELNASGDLVTHVGSYEASNDPADASLIEVSSLVYERKVATSTSTPWTGTWDAPVLIDSTYVGSQLVFAVPGTDSVFYVYLKPMYYQSGPNQHYCTNGLGHYQFCNNVVYKLSTNNGVSWPATPTYVTDFGVNFEDAKADPASYDISGLIDDNHVLHLVWSGSKKDPENPCGTFYAGQMWHWDSDNNCVSIAYDASEPALFPGGTDFGAWNIVISKMNVSVCDGKLYIAFTRFGNEYYVNADGDKVATMDFGVNDGNSPFFMNGDILVVVSENGGQTWSDGVNLTDTQTDTCVSGECDSEHWPTMAMFMNDSLMIQYIHDTDPGTYVQPDEGIQTENPVIFMTWPCFTVADVGANAQIVSSPPDPTFEVPLKPSNESDCTTDPTWTSTVLLQNTGNVNQPYSAVSDAAWLTITSGGSGSLDAGVGPRGIEDWTNGVTGCASPAELGIQATSGLTAGLYTGTITVTFSGSPAADPIDIVVNAVVACKYFEPEYATITGGCWDVDVWNIPRAGNGSDRLDMAGNMKFYACNYPTDPDADYFAPMYNESFLVGWNDGEIQVFGDMIDDDFDRGFKALDSLTITTVGNPGGGQGYYLTSGAWASTDSCVQGTIQYVVPGHQDTALLIERITFWSECGNLTDFVIGEGIDWDVRADSNRDDGGVNFANNLIYQRGANNALYENCYAGVYAYEGPDNLNKLAGAILDNENWVYPEGTGYNPDSVYNKMFGFNDGDLLLENDSVGDLNTLYRFWNGTLNSGTTLEVIKFKGVSCDGEAGMIELLVTKGTDFMVNNEPFAVSCQGLCGDANNDSSVDVSDAVYIINYAFAGGSPPQPVIACGDANSDG